MKSVFYSYNHHHYYLKFPFSIGAKKRQFENLFIRSLLCFAMSTTFYMVVVQITISIGIKGL